MAGTQTENKTSDTEDFPLEGFVRWSCKHPIKLLLILFGIGLIPVLVTNGLLLITDLEKWIVLNPNDIGDTFGFLNALMSSLAFIGVLSTLWMQRQELALQRRIMRENQEEQKKSTRAQELSEKRLAATTALNALESLRRSLEIEKRVGNGAAQDLKRKKVHLLIEGILEDVLVEHKDSIETEQIQIADEINRLIIKVDSDTKEFNADLVKEIQKSIQKWRQVHRKHGMRNFLNDLDKSIENYNRDMFSGNTGRRTKLTTVIAPMRDMLKEVVDRIPSTKDFVSST